MASRHLFNKSKELREIFNEVYDNPSVLPIFDNASISTKTVTFTSAQDEISISVVVATVGASPSVSIDVYPIDMFGNVLNSTPIYTQSALTAVGNAYGSFSTGRFRQFSIVVTASGTLTGTVVVYG